MRKLFMLAGGLLALYGMIIISIIGTGSIFNYFLLCCGVMVSFLAFIWKKLGKKVRKALTVIIIAGLMVFGALEALIINQALKSPAKNADYVILLGSQVRVTGPSIDFMARINSAYDYLKENQDTVVIVTGAQGEDEPASEAATARAYLMDMGIDESRILMEDRSYNTAENMQNAYEVIKNNGGDPEKDSVVIASASYHLFRAKFIALKTGFGNVTTLGSNGLRILIPHYYCREFFAFVKDFVVFTFLK